MNLAVGLSGAHRDRAALPVLPFLRVQFLSISAYHAIIWLIVVLLGFPSTYWDDSLIIGPSIGIIRGDWLRSVYLTPSFYPEHAYLFYPPSYFWAVAGWMSVFGKSVVSLSSFWATCGFVTSLSIGALLTRWAGSRLLHTVAPILVFSCIAYTGFRYEMLAFAMVASGLALGLGGSRFTGYLLLLAAPTVAPTVIGCATIAVAGLLIGRREGLFVDAKSLALAFFMTILWLAISVGGDIFGLVATMYKYREVRIGLGARGGYLASAMLILQMNLFSVAIARIALRRPWVDIGIRLPLYLISAWLITLVTHARPAMLVVLNLATVICCIRIVALAAADRWPVVRSTSYYAVLPLLAFSGLLALLNLSYATMIAVRPLSPLDAAAARTAFDRIDPRKLVVADARIMKDALDYPTERKVEDAMIRHPWPAIYQDFHQIPENEVWIMSRTMLISSLKPDMLPVTRSALDYAFIATGTAASPEDGICVMDANIARRWHSNRAIDLLQSACTIPRIG